MNVAIVTFQGADNYGAVFQAYALSIWLRKHQINPEIIDYNSNVYRRYKLFRTHLYKSAPWLFAVDLLAFIEKRKRKKNFTAFRKEFLPLTKESYKTSKELHNICNSYDYYICGSDQIWNPEITHGIDGTYFLDFVEEGKKIAYAPSIGVNNLNEFQINTIVQYLTSFNALSIREQSGKDLLQPYCEKEIFAVCDPVFLLDEKDFHAIAIQKTHEKYVFLYVVGSARKEEKIIRLSERLASEKSIKLYYIIDGDKTLFHIKGINMFGCNPTEFLSLIYNAQYVVSNSFHATAFSLIYEKQFVTFAKDGTSSRILIGNAPNGICLLLWEEERILRQECKKR